MPVRRMVVAWRGRQQASRKPRDVMTPLKALEQARAITTSLTMYAVFPAMGMIILRAIVSTDTFDGYVSSAFVSGLLLLVQTGITHRTTRRELRRSYPDLARALARRRWRLPGSGWAAFFYVPLLVVSELVAPEVLVAKHPGHGLYFSNGWMVILLSIVIIPLLVLWYSRSIRTPYIRLLEQAAQNSLSAATPDLRA